MQKTGNKTENTAKRRKMQKKANEEQVQQRITKNG